MASSDRIISASRLDDEFIKVFIEELGGVAVVPEADDTIVTSDAEAPMSPPAVSAAPAPAAEPADAPIPLEPGPDPDQGSRNRPPPAAAPAASAEPIPLEPIPAEEPGEAAIPFASEAPAAPNGAGPASYQLRLRRPGAPDCVMPLGEGPLTIGRKRGNAIMLQCPRVSQNHARIQFDGGKPRIDDLGSANGTWVNGSKVPAAYLRFHDEVRIGSVTLIIEPAGYDHGA